MAHRWQNLILLSILTGALVACSKSDDNDKASAGDYRASYEAADGCTTGRQVFSATTEDDIRSKFCEGLKDEKLNKSCAVAQREQVFKMAQCQGAWPHTATTGSLSTSSQQYAFSTNGCSTGNHLFVASSDSAVKKILCKALADDEFNRNCAKDQRAEMAQKNGCSPASTSGAPKKETDDTASSSGTPKPAPSQNSNSVSADEKKAEWSELTAEEFQCGTTVCDSAQQYCLKSFAISKVQSTATCQTLPKTCMQGQDAETCLRQDATEILKGTDKCEGEFAIQKSQDRISVRCSVATSKKFMIRPKQPPTRRY